MSTLRERLREPGGARERLYGLELTEAQVDFVFYALGYVAADSASKQDFIDENLDGVLRKLIKARTRPGACMAEAADKATQICCLAQNSLPPSPERAQIVHMAAEITNILAPLR